MRDEIERLNDILEAIGKIEKYVSKGRKAFDDDELLQVWVIFHLQIIGEASNKLSASIREKYSDIPWPEIISMRNLIVHAYFGIDLEEIWATVINDMPKLKKRLTKF